MLQIAWFENDPIKEIKLFPGEKIIKKSEKEDKHFPRTHSEAKPADVPRGLRSGEGLQKVSSSAFILVVGL